MGLRPFLGHSCHQMPYPPMPWPFGASNWPKYGPDSALYGARKEIGKRSKTITEKDVDLVLDCRYELRGMSWSPAGARDNLRVRLTFFNQTENRLAAAAS